MRGDYSRFTFDSKKHYNSVRMQQGRMQLDADWNEAQDIRLHHERMIALDAIGPAGGPRNNAGFSLSYDKERDDFRIGMGRYYVDGILCENDSNIFYSEQPHHPEKIKDMPNGHYLAYLDLWESSICAIEDPEIREVALGGPDTTTRTKVMWRLQLELLSKPMEYVEEKNLDLQEASPISQFFSQKHQHARMAAKIGLEEISNDAKSPCSAYINEGHGYLGNNLYRVEIHDAGRQGAATFKWSRDNCSVIRAVGNIDKKTITLLDPARNCAQIFHPGQFVEITDDGHELRGENGEFARIESIDNLCLTLNKDISELSLHNPKALLWDGEPRSICKKVDWMNVEITGENVLRVDGKDATNVFTPGSQVEISNDYLEEQGRSLIARVESVSSSTDGISLRLSNIEGDFSLSKNDSPEGCNAKIRRVDWIDLEMDIKVAFRKDDEYQKGDYWIIPSREITGRITWPKDKNNQPEYLDRQGVVHHLAGIAEIEHDEQGWTLHDRRHLFPKLVGQPIMAYGGGDGQNGWPGEELEAPFQIIVTCGGVIAAGEEVQFKIEKGEGNLFPEPNADGSSEVTIKTDELGSARCYCRLDSEEIIVDARLKSPESKSNSDSQFKQPPIRFRALALGSKRIGYRPPQDCKGAKEIKTVGEAIDALYRAIPAERCSVSIGEGGQYPRLDDAILQMIGQKKNDICLCLLPGRHTLEKSLLLKRSEGRFSDLMTLQEKKGLMKTIEIPEKTRLCIRGSGAGSRIVLDGGKRIILEGLDSLHLENLEIEGDGREESLLTVKNTDHMNLNRCNIRATSDEGTALSIRNGEGMLILGDNQIEGLLCLYEGSRNERFWPDVDETRNMKKRVCHLLGKVRRGTLTLRNNRIKRIEVGNDMGLLIKDQLAAERQGKPADEASHGGAKFRDIFQQIILSGNVINDGPNMLLAGNLILSGNLFDRQTAGSPADASPEMNWAISGKSVFMGNIGDETKITSAADESEIVANLLEIISL